MRFYGVWDIVICLVLCLIFAVPILLVWRSWKKEEQQMLEEEAEIERIRPFMDYVILTVVQEFFPNGTTYQFLRPYRTVTMSLWVGEEVVRVRVDSCPNGKIFNKIYDELPASILDRTYRLNNIMANSGLSPASVSIPLSNYHCYILHSWFRMQLRSLPWIYDIKELDSSTPDDTHSLYHMMTYFTIRF